MGKMIGEKKELKIILVVVLAAFLFVASSSLVGAQLSSVTNPLDLENVTTSPGSVYVGSSFVLTGTVRNVADRSLMYVTLTVQGGFPFSKTSPLTSFSVGTLPAGQAYQFSIPLTIDNDATNQQYSLQIKADYAVYDPSVTKLSNVINSETLTASVKVDKGADLEIANVSFPQPIIADMKDGLVTVYLHNQGIAPAEQVELNLAAEYPFTPTGRTFFVTQIMPSETKAATFHIDVDSSAAAQTFPLDMTINWKEGNNQYSDTKTFGIPVTTTSLTGSLSGDFKSYGIGVVIIIVVAAAAGAFLFWKKKGRKSRNPFKPKTSS